MIKTNPIDFQAKWNVENQHLNNANKPLYKKILKVITDILFFIPKMIMQWAARRYILSCNHSETEKKTIRAQWNTKWDHLKCEPLTLKTPDGVNLSAVCFKHQNARQSDIPTIICFNGQEDLYENSYDWILKKAAKSPVPFNVVLFNYRGTGESKGKATGANSLIIDGDTVYQYVRDQMGISEKNIRLHGFSLGGGVSAQVAALHPKLGIYVNSHSFSSLSSVVNHSNFYVPRIFRPLTCFVVKASGWDLNTQKAWNKIQAHKAIFGHPQDLVISPKAALNPKGAIKFDLDLKKSLQIQSKKPLDHHGPYSWYRDQEGLTASKSITNFLLGMRVFKSNPHKKHNTRVISVS